MTLFTASHTNPDGKSGVAACVIRAQNYGHFHKKFAKMYPGRVVSQVGELGKESR